jgi:predicted nucleotidyltransferase
MGFLECIKAGIEGVDELREELYALILFGSYVRGDFVEGVSDLDFFAVIREGPHETIIPRLRANIEECMENVCCILVDMPWEYLENLDDPLNKGYPFKFLTFYQEDFIENHVVVYGEDVVGLLPRYDWRGLLRWRAERLLSNIERDRNRPEMLRIGAGEVIRMMALLSGAESINKEDVLGTLEALEDDEALEIFSAYLEGRELDRDAEAWAGFIRSRIGRMLEEYA